MYNEFLPMTERLKEKPKNQNGFKDFLSARIPENVFKDLERRYTDQARRRQSELETLSEQEKGHLQATGEYPIQTPYDAIQGFPGFLPPEVVGRALATRHCDIEVLVHPARMRSLQEEEGQGYDPIREKHIPVLDAAIEKGETVSFGDFGFGIRTAEEIANERGINPKDVEDSANELLATGTHSWTTDRRPTIPYMLSSTPDVVGAHTLATIGTIQGMGFVPVDSIWNDSDNQVRMWVRAMELLHDDLALQGNPERDYILSRAQYLIGATLKANPQDVRKRAPILFKQGVRTFRIYDPRSFPRMIEATNELRQLFGDETTIITGQTIGVDQAHEAVDAGANAVIVGVGEGGICKTPAEASLAVDNLLTGYQVVRSGLLVPVIYDAGVGPKTAIALGIGAGGVMKSQAIGKGIEKPPYMYWWDQPDGSYVSLYSGEAAARTKHLGGKFDRLGRPIFVEGADEIVSFNRDVPSTATALYYLLQSLATALVFQRGTINDIQHDPSPDIRRPSSNAIYGGTVHHSSR